MGKFVYGLFLATQFCCLHLASALPNDWSIREEAATIDQGKYILPNELTPHEFGYESQSVSNLGALISVGSFRGLAAASMASFSHVFLLDHDAGVVRFNRYHLQLISKAQDRYEYMARLMLCQQPRQWLSKLRKQSSNEAQYIQAVRRDCPQTAPRNRALKGFFEQMMDQSGRSGGATLADRLFAFISDVFSSSSIGRHFEHSFLKSDQAFEQLKNLIDSERVHVLQGSLTGTETLTDLAQSLRTDKIEVSVVDISNAMEYLLSGEIEYLDPASRRVRDRARFLANLEALPFHNQSRINLTVNRRLAQLPLSDSRLDPWWYLSLPVEVFKEQLRPHVPSFQHESHYIQWARRTYAHVQELGERAWESAGVGKVLKFCFPIFTK